MRDTKLCRSTVILVQHLGNHNLGERVFVDARGTLMHEDVVVNLCETGDAVLERNCSVQPEQSQVEVSSCDIFGLDSIRGS